MSAMTVLFCTEAKNIGATMPNDHTPFPAFFHFFRHTCLSVEPPKYASGAVGVCSSAIVKVLWIFSFFFLQKNQPWWFSLVCMHVFIKVSMCYYLHMCKRPRLRILSHVFVLCLYIYADIWASVCHFHRRKRQRLRIFCSSTTPTRTTQSFARK